MYLISDTLNLRILADTLHEDNIKLIKANGAKDAIIKKQSDIIYFLKWGLLGEAIVIIYLVCGI